MISNSLRQKLDFLIERYHDLVPNYASGIRELSLVELPEMVYNSNAIENSTLTLEDTEDILIRHQIRTDHQIREIFEATNLAKAMELLLDNPETEISVPLILQLHSILMLPADFAPTRSGCAWGIISARIRNLFMALCRI